MEKERCTSDFVKDTSGKIDRKGAWLWMWRSGRKNPPETFIC